MNPIETELTTAATDLLLAVLSVAGIALLARRRARNPEKVRIWTIVLALLGAASLLGAAAHGLDLAEPTRDLIWKPLNLALGLLVAFFLVGAAFDSWGQATARRLVPVAALVGTAFFAYTVISPGSFLVFVVYEAIAMIAALVLYVRLVLQGAASWTRWMAVAVALNIAAAAVQQTTATIRLGWTFDHNGVFHLLQAIAIGILLHGLMQSLEE